MIFPSIHFFTLTAALTAHLALGAALIPRSVPGSKHDTQTPFPGGPMPSSLPAGLDLLQTSIRQLGSFLNNGSVTSVQLVQAYLGETAVSASRVKSLGRSSTWTPLTHVNTSA
jgi:hypothetical protein